MDKINKKWLLDEYKFSDFWFCSVLYVHKMLLCIVHSIKGTNMNIAQNIVLHTYSDALYHRYIFLTNCSTAPYYYPVFRKHSTTTCPTVPFSHTLSHSFPFARPVPFPFQLLVTVFLFLTCSFFSHHIHASSSSSESFGPALIFLFVFRVWERL